MRVLHQNPKLGKIIGVDAFGLFSCLCVSVVYNVLMDHLELTIYLKELKESMYDWDDGPISWQLELEKVQNIIKQLMDDTFNETDPTDRTLLAMLEYEARKIRDCIIRRNRMEN